MGDTGEWSELGWEMRYRGDPVERGLIVNGIVWWGEAKVQG